MQQQLSKSTSRSSRWSDQYDLGLLVIRRNIPAWRHSLLTWRHPPTCDVALPAHKVPAFRRGLNDIDQFRVAHLCGELQEGDVIGHPHVQVRVKVRVLEQRSMRNAEIYQGLIHGPGGGGACTVGLFDPHIGEKIQGSIQGVLGVCNPPPVPEKNIYFVNWTPPRRAWRAWNKPPPTPASTSGYGPEILLLLDTCDCDGRGVSLLLDRCDCDGRGVSLLLDRCDCDGRGVSLLLDRCDCDGRGVSLLLDRCDCDGRGVSLLLDRCDCDGRGVSLLLDRCDCEGSGKWVCC